MRLYQISQNKIILLLASILLLSSLLSCSGGSTAKSSRSTSPMVVQSIYPANGDTNIGIATPIVVEFQFQVESNGVIASLVNLDKPDSENAIPLSISGSGTLFTFTPDVNLAPNSRYRFKLSRQVNQAQNSGISNSAGALSEDNSSTVVSTTYTTQEMYKIFNTSGSFKGDLISSYASASEGADALCNADAANPDRSKYYKAMLTVIAQRYACVTDNICGGSNSLDWVLQASTAYYNLNASQIATANPQGVFAFPLANAIGLDSSSKNVWTGLTDSWGTSDNSASCKSWTSRSGDDKGKCGRSIHTNVEVISNDQQDCNGTRYLYCVTQPSSLLINPQPGSTTANYSTPITVMFNLVGGVASSTVNTNTFTVVQNNIDESSTNIPGSITYSGSSYTFTPSNALAGGKSYSVNLSGGITSTSGVAITPATFSFNTAGDTKLIFLTTDKWWGDLLKAAQKAGSTALTGVDGADFLCQSDAQCPSGKTCKAVISDNRQRIACIDDPNDPESSVKLCGAGYSQDWVLTPNTTYVRTDNMVLGTSNSNGIFNFMAGFQFANPIGGSGKAWTGLLPYWTSNKDIVCSGWTIGDSGVNKLAGMLGYPDEVNYKSISAGEGHLGNCSQYNFEDITGKYCYTEEDGKQVIDGCSKRPIYCAVQ